MNFVLVAFATIVGGLSLDGSEIPWARPVVVIWSWLALACVLFWCNWALRVQLLLCVAIATAGELFLMNVWGIYRYRLDDLPAYVPAGHALAYGATVQLARHTPRWWPFAAAAVTAPWVVFAAWHEIDTQGVLWFPLFLACLFSRDRVFFAVLFTVALGIELFGTIHGGWEYHDREPVFGLTTTNPPVMVGAMYCALVVLVRCCYFVLWKIGQRARAGPWPRRATRACPSSSPTQDRRAPAQPR